MAGAKKIAVEVPLDKTIASLDDPRDFSVHKKKRAPLDDLKDFISYASKTFKEKNWPATPLTFNSYFWHSAPEGLEHFKKIIEDAVQGTFEENRDFKKFFKRFLDSLKSTQLITVAVLVVASLLQKWESIYKSDETCFELLGSMIHIANLLLGIESRKIEMGDSLILKLSRRSMNCIMDGFWLCCSALGAFSSYSREEEDFYAVKKNMFKLQMQLTTCKTINKNSLKLEQVTDLLELEADTNALAVVLQGYGGLGKTTLADAVFSNVFVEREEFLCSKVEISQNSNSISHIIELQVNILKGLQGDEEVSVSSDSEGRSKIDCSLREAAVFIYIGHHLRELSLRILDRVSGFSHVKSTAHRLLQLYHNTRMIREWSPPKEKDFVFLMDCTIIPGSEKSRFISCNHIADEKETMLKILFQDGHTFLVKELFNFKEKLCYGFETKEISMCTNSGKQIRLLVMFKGDLLNQTALKNLHHFRNIKHFLPLLIHMIIIFCTYRTQ